MTPAVAAALATYRDQMANIVPDDQRENDDDLAAMLVSDLREAFPGVVAKSEGFDS